MLIQVLVNGLIAMILLLLLCLSIEVRENEQLRKELRKYQDQTKHK